MSLILNIETATAVCSVALAKDGKIISNKEQNEGYTHAENLTVFIEDVVTKSGFTFKDIDAIAVSKGPGSYTGLRIGISTAKGLCYALDKPLISVNTLLSLAKSQAASSKLQNEDVMLCPMIDARRMEVYCAIYDSKLNCVRETAAEIINENSFSDLLKKNKLLFFGDGAAKCKHILSKNTNAVFINDIFPSAKNMITLSEAAFKKNKFENVAYFEPFYLKDFVAGKKKIPPIGSID